MAPPKMNVTTAQKFESARGQDLQRVQRIHLFNAEEGKRAHQQETRARAEIADIEA